MACEVSLGEIHRTRGPCLDGATPHNIYWSTVRFCGASGQLVLSTTLHYRALLRDRHPPRLPTTAHRLSHAQVLRIPDSYHSV